MNPEGGAWGAMLAPRLEVFISNMHDKFGKDTWKKFKSSRPQVNVNADADADDDDAEPQLQWPTFINQN